VTAPVGRGRSSLGRRPDIDGLRAVAVVPVLLFHAGLPACPGGFVGVDVFFVISGFLITSHLLRELDRTARISLTGFWARRARRLLPAAFLVPSFSAMRSARESFSSCLPSMTSGQPVRRSLNGWLLESEIKTSRPSMSINGGQDWLRRSLSGPGQMIFPTFFLLSISANRR